MGTFLTTLIGKGALKAWFGGGAAAVAPFVLQPILEGFGVGFGNEAREAGILIGEAAGRFVLGYVTVWLGPKNKEADGA